MIFSQSFSNEDPSFENIIKNVPKSITHFSSNLEQCAKVPGRGVGTALLDIGNQLEFKVDCPLNGPSSRL